MTETTQQQICFSWEKIMYSFGHIFFHSYFFQCYRTLLNKQIIDIQNNTQNPEKSSIILEHNRFLSSTVIFHLTKEQQERRMLNSVYHHHK